MMIKRYFLALVTIVLIAPFLKAPYIEIAKGQSDYLVYLPIVLKPYKGDVYRFFTLHYSYWVKLLEGVRKAGQSCRP